MRPRAHCYGRGMRRLALGLCSSVLVACSARDADGAAGFVDAPIAAVAAPLPGQVAEVLVHEGETVRRGQVLARLDARERRAMLAEALANLERARAAAHQAEHEAQAVAPTVRGASADVMRQQAALEEARIEFDRLSRLVATGAAAPSALDPARARLDEARAAVLGTSANRSASQGHLAAVLAAVETAHAAVASAEAAFELARVQLAETEITSPFDGTVAEKNVEVGEWAAPGTPVVTVEDSTRRWVRIDLEETSLHTLRLGTSVPIRIVALPGRRFTGRVQEIGAEAEFAINRDVRRGRPDVRTFRVRIAFDRAVPELRPGMTAEVDLPGTGSSR